MDKHLQLKLNIREILITEAKTNSNFRKKLFDNPYEAIKEEFGFPIKKLKIKVIEVQNDECVLAI